MEGVTSVTARARTAALACALSVALVLAPVPRARAGTLTGGATEWTQVANMVQLIQHTVSLIQSVMLMQRQVRFWIQAAKRADSPWDAYQIFNGFWGILNRIRGILFAGESILKRWELTHPGRKDPMLAGYTSPELYRAIDDDTRKAVSRSLEVLEVQAASADGWPKDQEIFEKLQNKMQSVNGQLEAAMTANELLLEILRQLHLLRQVQIAQAEMMGYHVSNEVQRRQLSDIETDKRFRYTGRYRGDGSFDGALGSW